MLIVLFLFHCGHASSTATVSVLPATTSAGWCEKTGSGTEILLFLSSGMTWGELEKGLGFDGSLKVSIIKMIAVWNDMDSPLYVG
ncbi:hypothetical protein COT69_02505 [candidate division WWE3 bacterium CG09_land_8_20_14_0_10_39_24]|uniref:Uncharacterized protein n=2 Tax=Katanobacteria TaxID=422282 RepID=A0A2G9XDN8_UNCKA|nr:MAG: hypothetical protein BK003_02370 [bacterium CG09_39_24]PIP04603.1 MAG: hypothetical protein COX53_01495 [candidate division WWE3 bacterium CG23_combo_of_CG06-09_8_20_14_all_40_14]PIS12728.1 MAG: hypothetical protein COT69_02505 [candidate division WWE3 bacterium CG09_land_8_20_14_0_10_39_24]PJE52178.1 MAG: hypothetical protein COV27_00235 [candidate division WWE3 bacterium CG10_big_fil_rev_8_21_14_0_10_39_14]